MFHPGYLLRVNEKSQTQYSEPGFLIYCYGVRFVVEPVGLVVGGVGVLGLDGLPGLVEFGLVGFAPGSVALAGLGTGLFIGSVVVGVLLGIGVRLGTGFLVFVESIGKGAVDGFVKLESVFLTVSCNTICSEVFPSAAIALKEINPPNANVVAKINRFFIIL
ncbi:hypothetical protein [Arcticibacter eurypsychrophilus]|uniref:hypothetical protein n=1 Tax=Arcticibacter eurypsychrophilus TaxID=1434752 RepID=UPI00084D6E36|nr:hypothetical protein [Arcticibacter eurypsychrophilus]